MAVAPQVQAPRLHQLVTYFLRLGTLGFGGPIALAGCMQRELVEERGWFSRQEYLDGLAFAQLCPGPLAAQLAMFLGFVRGGAVGCTLAGIAFVLPSFLMVVALATAYVRYGGLPWMQACFYGVGAAVVAIIARAAGKLARSALGRDRVLWTVFTVLAVATAVTGREVVWLFIAGGVVAAAPRWVRRKPVLSAGVPLLLAPVAATSPVWQLLFFFSKAGLVVFGSGLAIVPFLYGGVVQEYRWLTERQFLDAVAVAMITPGPVVITVAFIGYLVAGVSGACAAAAGVFLPAYLLTVVLAPHYQRYAEAAGVREFVKGVTAAATGALAGAVIVLARRAIVDPPAALIAAAAFAAAVRWKLPEPLIVGGACLLGLLVHTG